MAWSDPREAFVGPAARLDSPLGPLELGVVDADVAGIAEAISGLLVRSIQDARAEVGGHLPTWLVRDIERNYISPERVRTLWAPTGHRFALVLDREIVGTIHVAKSGRTILTVDRHTVNVDEDAHPGFKPPGHHHVVNISVRHELRRAHLARRMLDGVVTHFRHLFEGEGLWVRADPPWHRGLSGLGFVHDPRLDVFLPPSAEQTAGLPHAVFNARHACSCLPRRPELETHKLQYVSMTRAFPRATSVAAQPTHSTPRLETPSAALRRDFGATLERTPRAVVRPSTVQELAAALAWATGAGRRVTVRGRGQSHAGQALGEDVVLSTEALDRVLGVHGDVATVEGGCTWRALAATGACPVVLPTIADASIGGTLSSLGLGFGSLRDGLAIDHVVSLLVVTGDGRQVHCDHREARWLFEAVLGGYGQFGVLAHATVRLAASRAFRREILHVEALADALCTLEDPGVLDASFRVSPRELVVRRAFAGERQLAEDVATRATAEPPGPNLLCQLVVPRRALATVVALLRARVDLDRPDEALWLHPVLERADRPSLCVPRVAPAQTVFVLTLSSEVRDRDVSALRARNDAIALEIHALGGAPTLQSTRETLAGCAPWPARDLERERIVSALADPAGVLASGVSRGRGSPRSPSRRGARAPRW